MHGRAADGSFGHGAVVEAVDVGVGLGVDAGEDAHRFGVGDRVAGQMENSLLLKLLAPALLVADGQRHGGRAGHERLVILVEAGHLPENLHQLLAEVLVRLIVDAQLTLGAGVGHVDAVEAVGDTCQRGLFGLVAEGRAGQLSLGGEIDQHIVRRFLKVQILSAFPYFLGLAAVALEGVVAVVDVDAGVLQTLGLVDGGEAHGVGVFGRGDAEA